MSQDGDVIQNPTSSSALIEGSGNDPQTGEPVSSSFDPGNPPPANPPPGDWFAQLSNFSAGMADAVSGGLTKRARTAMGYNDAVNTNSRAYGVGQVAGQVVGAAVQNLTPCRFVGLARNGVRALHAVQGTANLMDAGDAFQSGNILSGMDSLMAARGSFGNMLKSCFAAGTPIRTPDGSKMIENLQIGDLILSRDEFDATGPVSARMVEEVFVNVSLVWHVHIGGQVIRTTAEHPFYAHEKGWVNANQLADGDWLLTENGHWLVVEDLLDTGEFETVYNCRIADNHTYFVGTAEWGFAVWAHNACAKPITGRPAHGSPPHNNRMISEAQNPKVPPGVTVVEVRTNQALMNPGNPNGKARSPLKPDVQVLGSDGKVYITEVNRTGGKGYHRPRENDLQNALGKDFGGYTGINIP
ncbi:MAG TPA: polymorphic toxin-type HINT domain-containing protein [Urbifossiella sp.]|nr:polymorphic toxin-type HINT domain-containing protein [Urbifossiella sp.]